jgi:hypothetical protein
VKRLGEYHNDNSRHACGKRDCGHHRMARADETLRKIAAAGSDVVSAACHRHFSNHVTPITKSHFRVHKPYTKGQKTHTEFDLCGPIVHLLGQAEQPPHPPTPLAARLLERGRLPRRPLALPSLHTRFFPSQWRQLNRHRELCGTQSDPRRAAAGVKAGSATQQQDAKII